MNNFFLIVGGKQLVILSEYAELMELYFLSHRLLRRLLWKCRSYKEKHAGNGEVTWTTIKSRAKNSNERSIVCTNKHDFSYVYAYAYQNMWVHTSCRNIQFLTKIRFGYLLVTSKAIFVKLPTNGNSEWLKAIDLSMRVGWWWIF